MLLVRQDRQVLIRIRPLLPLGIGMTLVWLLLSVQFWFYVPVAACAWSFLCFVLAYLSVRKEHHAV